MLLWPGVSFSGGSATAPHRPPLQPTVGDVVVVGSELPQRLAGRPAPNQLRVGNELAQSTLTLHSKGF